MKRKIEQTTIESKSITVREGELLIGLGLRDKECRYSNTSIELVLCKAFVEALKGIIEVAGTDAWVRIESCSVRVQRDDVGKVVALGHTSEDKWVDLIQVNR